MSNQSCWECKLVIIGVIWFKAVSTFLDHIADTVTGRIRDIKTCNITNILLRDTAEPVLKGCPIGHKNVVSQDRWSLVTSSFALKGRTLRPKLVVLQDRWSHASGFSREVSVYFRILFCAIIMPSPPPPIYRDMYTYLLF